MTTPQQQPPPRQGRAGEYAAAAAGASPALAAIGSGVGLVALGVGGALSAAAVAEIVEQALDALREHARGRVGRQADELRTTLEAAFPERTGQELDPIVRQELTRERQFQRKMEKRIRRDLPKALAEADADARRSAVEKVLKREERYVGMRVQAMHDRAIARAEHLAVQEASPSGAYWWLSPDVMHHTVDCLALGHLFWPWSFLQEAHPPLHVGCRCELLTLSEAVSRGYMTEDQVPDPAKAHAEGRRRLERARQIEEAATPAELRAHLAELVEGEVEGRLSAIARRFPSVDYGQLWWNAGEGRVFYNLGDADSYQHEVVTRLFLEVPGVRAAELGEEDGAPEGEGWQRLDTSPLNPLLEARWVRRYPAGVHEGGRFAPKAGAVGHRLLRDLLPDLPAPPRERRDRRLGSWRTLNGRRVYVPEARRFDRVIRGRRFVSEPGSTEVQHVPGAHEHGGDVYLGRRNAGIAAALAGHRRRRVDEAAQAARAAAAARDPQLPPVTVGQKAYAADGGLLAAGFTESGFNRSAAGAVVSYWAPDGSSQLDVTYDGGGKAVVDVAWRPREPEPAAPALDRPPRSFREFTGDLDSFARRTALEHGRGAVLTGFHEDPDGYEDHAAETLPDGRVMLGAGFRPALEALYRARGRGGGDDDQLRQAYASEQSGLHEMLHAATAYDADVVQDPAASTLEESLAEELSHVEAGAALKRRGEHDVADWRADHPLDYKALGTYQPGRAALGAILDGGEVPAEDREALLRRLLLDTPPRDRIDALAAATNTPPDKVRAQLAHPPDPGGLFVPILAPALEPTHRPTGLEWEGRPVQAGDRVQVRQDDGQPRPATVVDAQVTAGRPLATVAYDDGEVEHAVPASRLAGADTTPPRLCGSSAAGAANCREGDRVEWGGGEGVVSRVLRPDPDWVLDVRLDDGRRTLLTPARAPNLHATGADSARRGTPRTAAGPRTLEQKALERTLFDAPPEAPRAHVDDLVPTERPDGVRANPPAAGPLRTRERPDGRLDVVGADSQRLYAARERGLARVPVTTPLFPTWPYELASGGRGNEPAEPLDSLNPTGGLFVPYDPQARARAPLGGALTTLDRTMGVDPATPVTIYRGAPEPQREIVPGDYVTTNRQLASDYGAGRVLEKRVPASHVLDDASEPLGEEYIYRPPGRRNEAAAATEPQPRGNGVADLRARWARLDRELLPFAGRPNDPAARRIIAEQVAVTSEIHHLHLDEGGPAGIGLPGGPRDVVVVGAGPAGLSAAIYGATEGLDTLLVDAEPQAGGQAYHSSRIENVLGFPSGVTGRQLAEQGLEQARRTGAEVQLGTSVVSMELDRATGLKRLELSDGRTVEARAVVIAGGVQFRRLSFPGSDSPDVVYGDSGLLKERAAGRPVVVVGGANSAGQAAIDAATSASHVTVLVRKGSIRDGMSSYLVDQLEGDPRVTIVQGEVAEGRLENGRLRSVRLRDGTELDAGAVGVFIGSAPQTGWASGVARDAQGQIEVGHGDELETSLPGVYAAGDVRQGSIHRVITAAADGAAAISMTHGYLATLRGRVEEAYLERDHPRGRGGRWVEKFRAHPSYGAWVRGLDELERGALYRYTGGEAGAVNEGLRTGRPDVANEHPQLVERIDAAIARAPEPPADAVVWRGLRGEVARRDLAPGDVLDLGPGYQSTSVDPDALVSIGDASYDGAFRPSEAPLALAVRNPGPGAYLGNAGGYLSELFGVESHGMMGRYATGLSKFSQEGEYLLPRGTRFVVDSVEDAGDGRRVARVHPEGRR